jgi:hypothetical protein
VQREVQLLRQVGGVFRWWSAAAAAEGGGVCGGRARGLAPAEAQLDFELVVAAGFGLGRVSKRIRG